MKSEDCPAKSHAVSCSCGASCGTYFIEDDKRCICKCGDWASAVCLKLGKIKTYIIIPRKE